MRIPRVVAAVATVIALMVGFAVPAQAATTVSITVKIKDNWTALTKGCVTVHSSSKTAKDCTVNSSGAPTRATDADTPTELNNATVLVTEGTVNVNRMYTQTTKIVTVNTTSVTWAQFGAGATYTAGNGITIPANVITAVAKASGGLGVDSGGIFLDVTQLAALNIPKRYAVDVPASTPATITHSLGTKDVHVSVFLNSTGDEVYPDVVHTSTTVVTLTFASAPTAAQYRCVVIG